MVGILPMLGAVALIGFALTAPQEQRADHPTVHDLELALAGSTDGFGNDSKAISAHQTFTLMDPKEVPDHLLLAVLIAGSTGTRNPTDVALDLMHRARGDIGNLTHLDIVRETPGMGPSGRARLLAASEFARRLEYRASTAKPGIVVTSPEEAMQAIAPLITGQYEGFAAIYLDRRRRVLGTRLLTKGTSGFTIVDPQQVLRGAIELGASAFIIAHNHPSGDPTPSTQDYDVTRAVSRAGSALNLPLLDHIIIGRRGGWRSFATMGELPVWKSEPVLATR